MSENEHMLGAQLRVADVGSDHDLVGESAFFPDWLSSTIGLSVRTARLVANAQERVGRVDETATRLGDLGGLVLAAQVRAAQSSADLDGVAAALLEVLVSRLPGTHKPTVLIPDKLVRYLDAADSAFAAVARGRIGVDELARSAQLLAGPGKQAWRSTPEWVGGPAMAGRTWLAVPAGIASRSGLAQLLAWAEEESELPVIAKAAVALCQFELLSPFAEGNSALGQVYVGLELVRCGVLRGQLLPISQWIDRNRDLYYRELRRVVDSGDVEPWVQFFAAVVEEVACGEIALMESLEELRDRMLALLNKRNTGTIRTVLTHLVTTPCTNHNAMHAQHGISTRQASGITGTLCDAKALRLLNDARYAKILVCQPALHLLANGASRDASGGFCAQGA